MTILDSPDRQCGSCRFNSSMFLHSYLKCVDRELPCRIIFFFGIGLHYIIPFHFTHDAKKYIRTKAISIHAIVLWVSTIHMCICTQLLKSPCHCMQYQNVITSIYIHFSQEKSTTCRYVDRYTKDQYNQMCQLWISVDCCICVCITYCHLCFLRFSIIMYHDIFHIYSHLFRTASWNTNSHRLSFPIQYTNNYIKIYTKHLYILFS